MDNWFGVLVFLVVAWFLSKPLRDGFSSGLKDEVVPSAMPFSLEVVGESNYQDALRRVAGPKGRESAHVATQAEVICEDNNPHDKHAVRVEVQGMTVGYLSRDVALAWRRHVSATSVTCAAVIRGGWDRGGGDEGHYGVWLQPPAGFKT